MIEEAWEGQGRLPSLAKHGGRGERGDGRQWQCEARKAECAQESSIAVGLKGGAAWRAFGGGRLPPLRIEVRFKVRMEARYCGAWRAARVQRF